MNRSSPTTAAGSSPPSIEVDSALPAGSAALQSPSSLARSTALRFRLIRALTTLGSDGGPVSREPLVTASRQGSRGTKVGPHGCSRSSAPPAPFTIGKPVGRTIRSVRPLCVHRMANATVDEEMIAALFERMNGPPRHVDLAPRVHWTAKVALIAFAIASTLLVVTQ